MPISFTCPGCKKSIKAKESLAGRTLPCPGCGHALTVPAAPMESTPTGLSEPAAKKPAPVQAAAPTTAASEVKKPRVAPTVTFPTVAPLVAPAKPEPPLLEPQRQEPQRREPQRHEPQALPLADLADESKPQGLANVLPWDDDEEDAFKLQPLPAAPPAAMPLNNPFVNPNAVVNKPKTLPPAAVAPLKPSLAFRAAASHPFWQRLMLLTFVLCLIPLAFHVLLPGESIDEEARITETIAQLEPEQQEQVILFLVNANGDDKASLEKQFFSMLPEQRYKDAFLAYDSKAHWGMAFVMSVLFMGLLCAMAMDGSTRPWQLLAISAFTATGGIVLLLLFQYLAAWSAGAGFHVRGIIGLLFLIVKLIGYSYSAAMDPSNGFVASMLGFTFGVGLCEEFCKAMPLLAYFRNEARVTWRGAMLWGLASGIGFGIAEGVMYSGDYYNGRAYAGIYFVRFFSCVALHAIWTAAVAITLYRRQAEWQSADELYEHAFIVLKVIAVPMVLHGLYDTLLKQNYAGYALLTAVASFGYLGWLNYHCEKHE